MGSPVAKVEQVVDVKREEIRRCLLGAINQTIEQLDLLYESLA
jgi:hypothetical protein